MRRLLLLICFFTSINTCFSQKREAVLHHLNDLLVNTVMEDLYTPPIAGRIYVYPNIAFYECIRHETAGSPVLSGKLNGLKPLPKPPTGNNHFVSAAIAFSYVAQNLIASEYKMQEWRKFFVDSLEKDGSNTTISASVKYGKEIADSIISWTQKDSYMKSRGLMRYVTSSKDGTWQPTPLDYAQGLEPHWNTIRPLVMKTPSQFSPAEKLRYSPSRQSLFYKNVMEVYNIGRNLDSVRKEIAMYWDDNPNISILKGHLNYFVHKVSPAGHWMMIVKQACTEKNEPLIKSSLAYALTGIAMFDGFIACWDEKYKTNLVRPITIIQRDIDEKWEPFIQTPPFPEFTSGHSVISNAASAVLTALLGDNYSFTDHTEIPFGIKPRTFKSFNAAAAESSMSRVYGGIHYPTTARISIQQGQAIGKYVINVLYKPAKKAAP
jgi:hypothetical protein